MIAVNWGIYIWAVNNGHVVEASLGYFVNPLVSVLLGVVIFRERLRVAQWAAVGLGAVAVTVLAIAGGAVPWVALSLAASFGLYGLVKKVIPLAPTASLTAEGLVLALPALTYLVVLQLTRVRPRSPATAPGTSCCWPAPEWSPACRCWRSRSPPRRCRCRCWACCNTSRPVVQFLLGVFWFGENMPPSRWLGFALVWAALAVLSFDALRHARHRVTAHRAARQVAAEQSS